MKNQCRPGYEVKNGKCTRKKNSFLDSGKKVGITSMVAGFVTAIVGFLIWAFRPIQECAWWNIFCRGGELVTSPIYITLMIIFLIFGLLLVGYGVYRFMIGEHPK